MNQPTANAARRSLRAVCYKCKYKTLDPPENRKCPDCNFPLILQPQNQQSVKLNVREIFDRTSVEVGPKLPGLGNDAAPAPMPMQAAPPPVQGPPLGQMGPMMPMQPPDVAAAARRHRIQRITMALAFVSAIAIGVAAAFMQGGL